LRVTSSSLFLELHPETKSAFDAKSIYHVRMAVRDGTGKRTRGEKEWISKEATRE